MTWNRWAWDDWARRAVEDYRAVQKPRELAELGRLIATHPIYEAVEIGTLYGGTARALGELALKVATIDIDMKQLTSSTEAITYMEMKSFDAVDKVGPCDLLFIDGSHAYEDVAWDYRHYRDKVRPGGLIVLHDIVTHAPEAHCEVHRLWQEVQEGDEVTISIVDPRGGPWGGIGVVIA